jgi:hypothetical protein
LNVAPPTENDEVASWTGLASSQRNSSDPACSDFTGKPLSTRLNDVPTSNENAHALSFSLGPDSDTEKFLVFGTVFYAPRQASNPALQTVQTNVQLLSPTGTATSPTRTLSLDYTDDASRFSNYSSAGLRIAYLQDLVNIVNQNSLENGAICMLTKKQVSGNKIKSIETVYYWNRAVLLNEIIDKQETTLAPGGQNNDITFFGNSVACQ